jgi:hypothetical protein
MKHENHITTDLGLAALFLVHGAKLIALHQIDAKKVAFEFQGVDLDLVERNFWNKTTSVDALTYFEAIRAIKNRLYSGSY